MLRIEVINYPVYVRLGHFSHERALGQEILVTVIANFKANVGPELSDDLQKTVDYSLIMAVIERELKGRDVKLVETACAMLGKALLKEFWQFETIDVVIEKTTLPPGIAKGAKIRAGQTFSRKG